MSSTSVVSSQDLTYLTRLELTEDILIVTFPTLMHQFLVVVINNAIINAELYREVYIKENVDYPLQGGGSKTRTAPSLPRTLKRT